MPNYERHVFVCTNRRAAGHVRGSCAEKGSEILRDQLKQLVKEAGLGRSIRVNGAGCLDQCEHGSSIVVYPEQVWYGFVTSQDLGEIIESHLKKGQVVERLRLQPHCVNTSSCPHRGNG